LIHRDLKSDNILLTVQRTLSGGERLVAKVADFGLSRKLLLSPELQSRVVDNPTWLAPEIIRGEPYTGKADVYSFGIILWEMLCRQRPYAEVEFMWEIQEAVLAGERPPLPDARSCACYDKDALALMQDCWADSPDSRPSFTEVAEDRVPLKAAATLHAGESSQSRKLRQLQAVSAMSAVHNAVHTAALEHQRERSDALQREAEAAARRHLLRNREISRLSTSGTMSRMPSMVLLASSSVQAGDAGKNSAAASSSSGGVDTHKTGPTLRRTVGTIGVAKSRSLTRPRLERTFTQLTLIRGGAGGGNTIGRRSQLSRTTVTKSTQDVSTHQ
jgi:serine/threonine protein kinase